MVTRVKLVTELQFDPMIIGIVSQEPDYKLSLAINRKMGLKLCSISPLAIDSGDGGESLNFSRFSCFPERGDVSYELIANRSYNNFLFRKLNNIDFLFLIHDHEGMEDEERWAEKFRDIPLVTAVFIVSKDQLKGKNIQYLNY